MAVAEQAPVPAIRDQTEAKENGGREGMGPLAYRGDVGGVFRG